MSMELGPVAATVRSLAMRASIEMTPASLADAAICARLLGPGTAVYVPFLPRAQFRDTIAACRHLRREGLYPVPHLAARAVRSRRQLEDWLSRLADAGVDSLFLIAGDTARPRGPFSDTLRLLETGLLQRLGFKRLGIAGYPEGHQHIDQAALRHALALKTAYARETGTDMWLVSQFVLEAEPVAAWLRALRDDGITLPVRIGIPGPARLRTLLRYALRCGVGASAKAMVQRPAMARKLAMRWTPDTLLLDLARGHLADPLTPMAGMHVFPFGGLRQSAEWLVALQDRASSLAGADDAATDRKVMAS
ncbi:MAG TPA: hypothetical protein VE175_10405 [Woeseiaceae bacterium]|nr:hypothetical protein [Woeseiaceae bacterium]